MGFLMSMFGTDKIREVVADLQERFKVFWFRWRAPKASETTPVIERGPKPMSLARQWTMLEDHLQSEMARAQSVLQMQDTATLHLDAAHYALDRIAVELVDVMPSIVTIATVQPPRIYASTDRATEGSTHQEHSIAA